MFNYLDAIEEKFLSDRTGDFTNVASFKFFLDNWDFYFRNLWVPFSSLSFSEKSMETYVEALIADALFLVYWLTNFFGQMFVSRDVDFFKLFLETVFGILWMIPAVLDIALQITCLTLGFLTRSLTTLAYMGYYVCFEADEEANMTLKTLGNS